MGRVRDGFRRFYRRVKDPDPSPTTSPALSVESDLPPAPAIKKESQGLVAETSMDEKPGPIADTEDVPPTQRSLKDDAVPATDGDVDEQNKESGDEDDAPHIEAPPSLPPAPDRDLWSEAWKSPDLTDDAKNRLSTPWKSLRNNNSSELPEAPKGDKSTKRRDKAAEGDQKGGNTVNKSDYVQLVIRGTKQKMEDYQDRWGSESKTTTAGTAREVLVSVLTVKELLDAGFKFDPSGYGACAWAVVSFGLTLVDNDIKRMDQAFQATAYLSELLTRYFKTETHYRETPFRQSNRDTKELEDAIVEAYVAILSYSAAVKKAADGSRLSRIKSSFIALTDEPLRSLKITIEEKDVIVGKWKDDVDREFEARFQARTQRSLDDIEEDATKILSNLEKVQDDVAATREGVEAMKLSDLLDGLSSMSNSSAEKHKTLRRAIDKLDGGEYRAGYWFIEKREYRDWKEHPQSVLWLRAPTGCGKSSLCSSIIEDLATLCESEQPRQKLLVHWYFQFDKSDTKDLTPVLRSFLRQLASVSYNRFPKEIQDWLVDVHRRDPSPNWKTLLKKVKQVIKVLKLDIFIVLDGLDEVPLQSTQVERKEVLQLVSDLIKDANPNLHILLVSKPEDDIRKHLLDDSELKSVVDVMNIEVGLKAEIGDFIDTTMDNDESFKSLGREVKKMVTTRLNADGENNFLWVTSLLGELRQCRGKEDRIQEQLNKVPDTMAEMYDRGLASVEANDGKAMRLMLIWLLRHQRVGEPLTEKEVAVAARLGSASEVSKLLVRELVKTSERTLGDGGDDDDDDDDDYDDADDDGDGDDDDDDDEDDHDDDDGPSRCIEFVHFSAKEHLEALLRKPSTGSNETAVAVRSWFNFSDEKAHCEMATRCLEVLLAKDDEKESPLKGYAAKHWHKHYLSSGKERPAEGKFPDLDSLVEKLLTPETAAFESWLECCDPDADFASSDFDMERKEDDDDDEDNDSSSDSDNDGNSDADGDRDRQPRADPVYYAVKLELLDMAIKMMKQGAPCTTPGREGTVLQLALYHKHWEVADAVLCYSHDPETAVTVRGGPHGTPLYIASAKAEDGMVNMVKKLIAKGARADGTEDGKYGSALHAAAYFGHGVAVQLLLEEGEASVDQVGGMFGTPLHAAAAKGHSDIVKLLLDHKATPTMVSGLLGTALQAALARKPNPAVAVLQEAIEKRGIESRTRSGMGWKSAFDRLQNSNEMLFRQYTSLFPKSTSGHLQMSREQLLLAGVLEYWKLPSAHVLLRCQRRWVTNPLYEPPAKEQLEEIQRTLPNFDNCSLEHELNRQDFLYKALFWAGINHILKHLDILIDQATTSMEDAFFRTEDLDSDYEFLGDFDSRRLKSRLLSSALADGWRRRPKSRMRYLERRALLGLDYDRFLHWRHSRNYRHRHDGFRDMDMDLSDKLVLEMARQQKQLGHEDQGDDKTQSMGKDKMRLESIHSSTLLRFEGEGGPDGDTKMYLVVDSLLPLIKDLVEFGKQCDRLHGTAAPHGKYGTSDPAVGTIRGLTFEVAAAVARLAVSIEGWIRTDDARPLLAETVRLLKTVRLARITKLAKAASQQLPGLVREEVALTLDQFRDQMREQIRDLVREAVWHEMER